MISPDGGAEKVELTIPLKAGYVSVARLTVAGIANRLGFDIDTIEDIKVSLSEVCNRIIGARNKMEESALNTVCKIVFTLYQDSLGVDFYLDDVSSFYAYMPEGVFSQRDAGAGAQNAPDFDKLIGDQRLVGQYEDYLQLSLISLLMDEFIVNLGENCIVSMKKYLY